MTEKRDTTSCKGVIKPGHLAGPARQFRNPGN